MDAIAPPPLPAPSAAPARPGPNDATHLRLLSICHYVMAGFIGLLSLFPVIYLVLGIGLIAGAMPAQGSLADSVGSKGIGWLFVGLAVLFICLGAAWASLLVHAGRCLVQRRRHTLCMVVAAIACTGMPLGTLLGVFTLVVLTRASVRNSFLS